MIKTFDLTIFLDVHGSGREYHNISRTAVKYYLEYWREQEDFLGYHLEDH